MDIREMIERIQAVLKIVRQKIAETLALPYAKLYIALAAFMTIVFIIFTFPYDLLIRKQIRLMESSIGRSVQVGAIDFSLIGDTFIDDIEIVFKDGGELSLKDISMNVAVNPVTLLLNKTLRGKVAVQNMKYTKGALSIQNLLDAGFDLTFDKDGIPREGFLNLTVENVSVNGANIKGFNIPTVRFTSIKGNGTVEGGNLTVKSIRFLGNDLHGGIAGFIELKKFMNTSRVKLDINIDQDSRALDDYKALLSSLTGNGKDAIKISITGTVGNPRVNFPMGERGIPDSADE